MSDEITSIDPAAPTTAPLTPAPSVTPHVEPHTKNSLSASEIATMAEWTRKDAASGKVTPEQAAKIFDQLGATEDQRKPDTRTDEAKHLDASFPAAQPADYLIQYYTPGQAPAQMPKEVQAFDANARTWMSSAGMPREIGNSLASAITKAVDATKSMSPGELEGYRQREFAKLQQVHGPALQERLKAADDMIDQLESQRPGLLDLLGTHGIGKNAMIWNLLISHAQIFHARKAQGR